MGRLQDKLNSLPRESIAHELWRRGDISYLLFPHGQMRLYNFVRSWEEANPNSYGPIVLEAHRGLGKSYFLLAYCLERGFKYPHQQIRYIGPVFKQVLQLCAHNLGKLLQSAPEMDMNVQTDKITIRNLKWGLGPKAKSEIFFAGSNREVIENQRGLRSNMVVADEVRDIDNPDYVLTDVLGFTFVMQDNPLLILSSTPPGSPAHEWCSQYVPQAIAEGRYIRQTADDNEDFRSEDREKLLKLTGGEDTTAWKREALCQHIADESMMVLPEFLKVRADCVIKSNRPKRCYKFVCFDAGFKDATAVLFAFVDFMRARLVIEREVVQHYMPTTQLADLIKKTIVDLGWADDPLAHQIRYVADATPQQLADLAHDHHIFFNEAEKHDKWASLASLRAAIANGRIDMDPGCRSLIHQCETGVYNKTRKDFERVIKAPEEGSPVSGHLDAIAALQYLWRFAKDYMILNPTESELHDADHMWINTQPEQQKEGIIVTRNPLIITRNPF